VLVVAVLAQVHAAAAAAADGSRSDGSPERRARPAAAAAANADAVSVKEVSKPASSSSVCGARVVETGAAPPGATATPWLVGVLNPRNTQLDVQPRSLGRCSTSTLSKRCGAQSSPAPYSFDTVPTAPPAQSAPRSQCGRLYMRCRIAASSPRYYVASRRRCPQSPYPPARPWALLSVAQRRAHSHVRRPGPPACPSGTSTGAPAGAARGGSAAGALSSAPPWPTGVPHRLYRFVPVRLPADVGGGLPRLPLGQSGLAPPTDSPSSSSAASGPGVADAREPLRPLLARRQRRDACGRPAGAPTRVSPLAAGQPRAHSQARLAAHRVSPDTSTG